jgi:lysophospholipase L1-like esterase
MRRFLPIFLTLLGLVSVHADPLIQPNDSLAICGDSITEQKIYSVFMEDYLLMCQPASGQTIAQLGWGGETAGGFNGRLDSDLYPFKPTVVTTCYGMNDGHYVALTKDISDTYRQNQTAIVEALKKHGVRVIILGSSKCVDSTAFHNNSTQAPPDVYNQTLGALAAIDRDIAQKEGVVYADVYGATLLAMQKSKAIYGPNYVFGGGDGIHPGPNGHLVMAYAFLKALGCDGAIGTLTVEMGLNQAEGTPGQKIVSFQNGTLTVESSRYPFCFDGDPAQPSDSTACILKSVPFNEDLNRYVLVVKGLTAAKAKVTWGNATKEYTADQLSAGINLAAEFLNNPFHDAFNKVNAAVQAQQNYETVLVKNVLHNMPSFLQVAPKQAAALSAVTTDGMEQDRTLFQAAASLVTPIQHTIKIEPEP